MNDKMKDPECATHKVKITSPDYSKENYLSTFTPQKQLTPEQIFWSQDLIMMKAEAHKKQTTASRPIKALTVITPIGLTEGVRGFEQTKECYLTEVIPFFKTLKEHFEGIQKALTKEIKKKKDIFEELEVEVDQNVIDKKHDEIEQKNLLIANDNLIADCLSKEVFYVATNYELNIQKDNHNELVKRFSNLEVNHLNLQLKYQNLKENFGNNPPSPTRDTPGFDSVFVIRKMKASLQGKDNVIKKLKTQISHLQETHSEADHHTKHIEQTTALTTENENLKAQIQNKVKSVTKDHVKPIVLALGKYAIDVEPIPPRHRNNRAVHLDYLKHLKKSVKTLREIVEEAKVEKP
ncbi:hypothetical protein Tco_1197579 [Tanacetum coccineum]